MSFSRTMPFWLRNWPGPCRKAGQPGATLHGATLVAPEVWMGNTVWSKILNWLLKLSMLGTAQVVGVPVPTLAPCKVISWELAASAAVVAIAAGMILSWLAVVPLVRAVTVAL